MTLEFAQLLTAISADKRLIFKTFVANEMSSLESPLQSVMIDPDEVKNGGSQNSR